MLDFDVPYLLGTIPSLWQGLMVTIVISIVSIVLATLVGIGCLILRAAEVPFGSSFITPYVELIRNTPLLAQMFFIFYGLPTLGVQLSIFWSGVLTLVIWGGAYQAENLRGGLKAVGPRQKEAALALGMTKGEYVFFIALPQALRAALPSILNTAVSVLKNTAFLQAIGLTELTYVAMDRIAMDFRTLEMLVTLCVVYVGLVLLLSYAFACIERHMRKPYVVD